jgi:hypothetical protein
MLLMTGGLSFIIEFGLIRCHEYYLLGFSPKLQVFRLFSILIFEHRKFRQDTGNQLQNKKGRRFKPSPFLSFIFLPVYPTISFTL